MNDDLISRADTLKVFGLSEKTRKYGGDHSGYNSMMLYEIQDTIENMESVPAVPMSVIEDIKTEIEHMACRQYEHKLTLDREEVLEVIDKHLAESEDKCNTCKYYRTSVCGNCKKFDEYEEK